MSEIEKESGGLGRWRDESSPERTLLRASVARTFAESDADFGSVKVLSHEIGERILTPKRMELIKVLERTDVSSQRELARIVERDPGAVQRDLSELSDGDLINLVRGGRSVKPELAHDTIIIEPLVAPESSREDASYTVENEP